MKNEHCIPVSWRTVSYTVHNHKHTFISVTLESSWCFKCTQSKSPDSHYGCCLSPSASPLSCTSCQEISSPSEKNCSGLAFLAKGRLNEIKQGCSGRWLLCYWPQLAYRARCLALNHLKLNNCCIQASDAGLKCVCVNCWYELFNTPSHPLIIVLMWFCLSQSRNSYPTKENPQRFVCYAAEDSLTSLPQKTKSFLPLLLHSTSFSQLPAFIRLSSLLMNKTSNHHWIVHLHLFLCMLSCCCMSKPLLLHPWITLLLHFL